MTAGSVRHWGASLGVLEGDSSGGPKREQMEVAKGGGGRGECVCVFVFKQAEQMSGDGIRGTGGGLEPG